MRRGSCEAPSEHTPHQMPHRARHCRRLGHLVNAVALPPSPLPHLASGRWGAPGPEAAHAHHAAAALPHPETQPEPLRFFDCNVTIGPRPSKPSRARWSTEHLLEDMSLYEIDGALCVHALAQTFDVAEGNSRLRAELAKAPGRLFGVWCLSPLGFPGWFDTAAELLSALDSEGIRAVNLPAENTGWSLHDAMMGDTFRALEERRMLTFIDSRWAAPSGDLFAFFDDLLVRPTRFHLAQTAPHSCRPVVATVVGRAGTRRCLWS